MQRKDEGGRNGRKEEREKQEGRSREEGGEKVGPYASASGPGRS